MLYKFKMDKNTSMLKETLNKNAKRFPLVFNARTASSFPVVLYLNRTFSLEVQLEKSEFVENNN